MLKEAQAGNQQAFEKLMSIYLKVIYNYILSHVTEKEDAKDIVQETMLSIWKSIKNFHNNSTFKTWCISIVRLKIADYYRTVYKGSFKSIYEHDDTLAARNYFEEIDDKLSVERALDNLSKNAKEIVFLAFYAQLTYSEISRILDIPVGTVKSRMSTIKMKLNNYLRMDDVL